MRFAEGGANRIQSGSGCEKAHFFLRAPAARRASLYTPSSSFALPCGIVDCFTVVVQSGGSLRHPSKFLHDYYPGGVLKGNPP